MNNDMVGKRLRRERRALKLTQKEVADALGFSQGAISRIEKGERQVSIEMLERFSQLYSVSLESMLGINEIRGNKKASIEVDERVRPIIREIQQFSESELKKIEFAVKIIKSERFVEVSGSY